MAKKLLINNLFRNNPNKADSKLAPVIIDAADKMLDDCREIIFWPVEKSERTMYSYLIVSTLVIQSQPELYIFAGEKLMPIIASAKKALRQSKTKNVRNKIVRTNVRVAVKKSVKAADQTSLSQLFSAVDRAVKNHIIHKNKAARIKSRAAKKLAPAAPVKAKKKPAKKLAWA